MGSNSDHCSIIVEMYWHMGSNSDHCSIIVEMYWHMEVTVTTAQ